MSTANVKIIIEGQDKTKSAFGSITNSLQSIGKAAIAGLALAGTAVVGLGTKMVNLGGDAIETASLMDTSLGSAAIGLNKELQTLADTTNRSFYELQAGTSTFVAMTKNMGATEEQAAATSLQFTSMSNDLGSFFNVATDDAMLDLQSAIAGSSETLTKYGIDARETALKQIALREGWITDTKEVLPRWIRTQALAIAVQEQASDAMGDAARTSGSWTNIMRGGKAMILDFATGIGMKLIPALEPMVGLIMNAAQNALPQLLAIIDPIIAGIADMGSVIVGFFNNMDEGMSVIDSFIEAIWDIAPQEVLDALVNFRDNILPGLSEWFITNIQPVIDMVDGMVEFQDIMLALGVAIGSIIIPILITLMTTILPIIAVFAAVALASALLRKAWTENWGGIQEKMKAAWEFIQPFLLKAQEWLSVNVPMALEALRTFWVDVAWPAIQNAIQVAWPIIQTIFNAVKNFIIDDLIPTVKDLYQKWTEVWWPAISEQLQVAWDAISPVFDSINDFIKDDLGPTVDAFKIIWGVLWEEAKRVVGDAWVVVEPIFTTIKEWIDDKLPTVISALKDAWAEKWASIGAAVQGFWDGVSWIFQQIREFASWLSGHTFNVKFGSNGDVPNIPAMANGGDLMAGSMALVGEKGPELFVAPANGSIIPNHKIGGVGSTTTNNNYYLNANYKHQREDTIAQDIRNMRLLRA